MNWHWKTKSELAQELAQIPVKSKQIYNYKDWTYQVTEVKHPAGTAEKVFTVGYQEVDAKLNIVSPNIKFWRYLEDFQAKFVLNQTPLQTKALSIASKAFEGIFDKAGQLYIFHLIRVADQVHQPERKAIAFLHDILNNTNVSIYELFYYFPAAICDGIELLMRDPQESYADYINRIAQSGHADAIAVKIEALRDDMNLSRLANPSDKDIARTKKYQEALQILTAK